jgi:serine protease
VREDRDPVDPLPDLARVDVDERGDLDGRFRQRARMELPDLWSKDSTGGYTGTAFCGYYPPVGQRGRPGQFSLSRGRILKAFFAALAVGVFALIAGASTATSAPSQEHLLVGYDHAPTAADKAAIANVGGKIRHEFASIGALAVDLPSGKASDIRSQTGVKYVETDGERTPLSLSGTLPTQQLAPRADNGLYGLVTTHTVEAQAAGFKGRGVTACVADTGLDTRHPDIAPNLVTTYDVFSGKSGLHATDVYDLGVQKTETHATHVSGIVLGADNGLGIVGVAPSAKLEHARVLKTQEDGSVSGETSEVMTGVEWLATHGCKVINMSLGGGDRSQAEESLYNHIRNDLGVLIVVASGNDSSKKVSFPGGYQGVLTVGAVDSQNNLASFSNTGAQLDVVAPGVDNLSSFPRTEGRDAFATIGGKTYSAFPLEFAGATKATGVNAALVNCGLAQTKADCGAKPPAGFVALIQRGAVSFAQKVDSAMQAGAAAAIIYNNAANGPGNFNGTLGTVDDNGRPWIPAISLSQTDGEAIAAAAPATGSAFNIPMAWNYDSGTSMATPHVTGLAALILGKNPKLTPDQVETIIEGSTTDLGVPNYDTTFGWGLINSQAALRATP